MPLVINFPSFLKPEIIPGLPVRWYGLMYLVAFAVAFVFYRRQLRERRFPLSEDGLSSLFCWSIFGLLLGARLFSTLVYEPFGTNVYLQKPWLIFWPFRGGRFTGLQGMSYHGGFIGIMTGIFIWCRAKRYDVREITDMFAASIPLGYTAGRIGNFINAELYGRATAAPTGMLFPIPEYDSVNRFSAKLDWVREIAEKAGLPFDGASDILINLPRHPSQLYEAFFEGIFLWTVIWLLRKKAPFKGFLTGVYIGGYGLVRFFIEYFREPDADLGYRIQLGEIVPLSELAYRHPPLSFSTGQILCVAMMLCAALWLIIASRLPDSKRVYLINDDGGRGAQKTESEKKADKNARRKLRKKLR
ncbi:MAG: prolipoprotein diacylglyceryl transferase [Spirochaetaceae bacterium]|jgi:phosphatidylglycerol:prolipoprotein diacylglycerol transferase|nr:prolipoprotein diacylglyceryl transferase [Spirochaetaceae bacterium]